MSCNPLSQMFCSNCDQNDPCLGINFLLVEPGAQMGELLTSQRTMIYELKSDEGSNIVEYDPDNFKSDCWQLSPVMKTIVLGTIFMLLIV